MKRVPAYLLKSLLLLSVVVSMTVFTSCSETEDTAEAGSAAAEAAAEADPTGAEAGSGRDIAAGEGRVQKPERTLVFGEETDQSPEAESSAEVVKGSPVLRRNARFLEQAGAAGLYPVDLVIGKLSPAAINDYEMQQGDVQAVAELGRRFLESAMSGNMEQLQALSSKSSREVLRTQVGKWSVEGVKLAEIRIGEIQWDDAAAQFDFRILAMPGRTAGSVVAVFEDTQWRVQAIECDCGALEEKYEPVDYSGFPSNYGYFQY